MVSLADAKQYLGETGNDKDALIERLLSSSVAYLAKIGVETDPMPEPVGEAVLLLIQNLYRRTDREFERRQEQVEGIGSTAYFDPQFLDNANRQIIEALTTPFREIAL